MDRQQAAVCEMQGEGERHRKQQFTIAHTDPSNNICYFRVWWIFQQVSCHCQLLSKLFHSSALEFLLNSAVFYACPLLLFISPSPMSSLWLERNFRDQPYMWYVTTPKHPQKMWSSICFNNFSSGEEGELSFSLSSKPSIINKPSFMKFLLINLTCICWTFMIP